MIRGMFASLRARLLVATPVLGDPNFDRTVVLILEHTPEGVVGLVLNRPSGADLDEAGAHREGLDLAAAEQAVRLVGAAVGRPAGRTVTRRGGGRPRGLQ